MTPQFSNVISSSLPVRREPPCAHSSCGKFQGSGNVFRASYPVARRRLAVRERGVRDRLPGPDQVVPNLLREPEVGVAVFVDVTDLLTAEPVDGDADPARAVFVPPLEDSGPAEHFAFDQF